MKRLRLSVWPWTPGEVPQRGLASARAAQARVELDRPARTLGARAQWWLALLVVLLASYGTWSAGNWLLAEWQWR